MYLRFGIDRAVGLRFVLNLVVLVIIVVVNVLYIYERLTLYLSTTTTAKCTNELFFSFKPRELLRVIGRSTISVIW